MKVDPLNTQSHTLPLCKLSLISKQYQTSLTNLFNRSRAFLVTTCIKDISKSSFPAFQLWWKPAAVTHPSHKMRSVKVQLQKIISVLKAIDLKAVVITLFCRRRDPACHMMVNYHHSRLHHPRWHFTVLSCILVWEGRSFPSAAYGGNFNIE